MRNQQFNINVARALAVWVAFSTVSVWACSVPVFRYALEHWPPDPYQAVVFHRGALSDAEQGLAGQWGQGGKAAELRANVSVRTIDLDAARPEELEFWKKLGSETLPWVVVRYPLEHRLPGNVWSGPLSDTSAVANVLESPARKQIAQRLGDGQSAVWVLLEIGEQNKDDTAASLLESRLAYLMGVLELPKLEAQDIKNGLVSVGQDDLKLEFSVLRVSRRDPAEAGFVKTLLGTEVDLEELSEPMVFPVFGRGRALYALIGKGINHETIDEAASFLIGRCSCQVKELNPGIDLLVSADWDAMLKAEPKTVADLPAVAASTSLTETAPETVTITGTEPASVPAEVASDSVGENDQNSVRIPIAMGLAIVALMAAIFMFLNKK